MKVGIQAALVCLLISIFARAAELREIHGRVVDDQGQPAAGVIVGDMWSANGALTSRDGKTLDLEHETDQKAYWSRLGTMGPMELRATTTAQDGTFTCKIPGSCHAILAMDAARVRGGIGTFTEIDAPIEIRLGPLVRFHGSFEAPGGAKPTWSGGFLNVPEEPTRPLDNTRLVLFASNEARVDMSLPAGRYFLEANDDHADFVLEQKEIVLTGDRPDVDLGTMVLKPAVSSQILRKQSEARGTWGDYTKLYGKHLPQWHAIEGRGVHKNVQIGDFKGKWVLIDLWGLSCPICLEDMPKLIKFYEEHQSQRDQFEILSICLDYSGDLKSIADLDRELKPIVENVWGGKTLPFPLLLDNTFDTWERFGLPGLGVVLLVDPDGNLVEGDETTLAQKLK